MIVNNEQCVVGATHAAVRNTNSLSEQTGNNKARVVLRACSQSCARTTQHTPIQNKERREKGKERRGEKKESSVRAVEALVSLTLRRATT